MSTNLQLQVPDQEIMPNHRIGHNELICELRKTPTVLYGIFTEVVRQFYLNGTGYLEGCPKLKWDANPQKTDIWIDSELAWNDEHPEFRPAIYVKLGELQYETPLSPHTPVGFNMRDAVYKYGRIGKGTVSFVHVAQRAGESLILCDNTATFLTNFSTPIRNDFCFSRFVEVSRNPLAQSQPESSLRYASVTTFTYWFGEDWSIKLESPILKSLKVLGLDIPSGQERWKHDSISTNGKPPEL